MKRKIIVFLSCLGIAAGLAYGQFRRPFPFQPESVETIEQIQSRVYNRLATTIIDDIDWQDITVIKALTYIETVSGSTFQVYYNDEEWMGSDHLYGIDPYKMISLKAKHITALDLLERLLDKISNEFVTYTWQLDVADQIMVGSEFFLGSDSLCRIEIYDMSDLLFQPKDHPYAPTIDLQAALQNALPITDLITNEPIDEPTDYQKMTLLQRIIYDEVYPHQWRTKGGNCLIMILDKEFIVKAPDFVHRALMGYSWESK